MKHVMKKQTILAFILCFCLTLLGALAPVRQAKAAEDGTNESVLEDRKGVIQVVANITVDDKDMGFLTVGTGFLIGDEDSAQHVLTNYHVAHAYTDETMKAYLIESGQLGVTADSKVKIDLRIVVKRDVLIKASIVNESMAADFAILKMEQPIYDRVALVLADSDQVTTTQEVYALGFPGIVQKIQDDKIYTAADVTVTNGTVSKTTDVELSTAPIPCITHTAQITRGNSGGPLVDNLGRVIGINTIMSNEDGNHDYFYSTQINEIREVLDALGIPYMSSDNAVQTSGETQAPESIPEESAGETQAPETESVNTALLSELEAAVDSAEALNVENMTEDSVANFKAALSAAKATLDNESASEDEIKDAIDELDTAQKGLVEVSGPSATVYIIIAAAAVIVVIIVVVIIVAAKGNKKKKEEAQKAAQLQQRQQKLQQGQNEWGRAAQPSGMPQQPRTPSMPQQSFAPNDGAGETSVLNDGSSETTVLGGQSIPSAALIRKKTGERITVTKAVFKIGKERRKVDYCISDNTNVSRTHADIIFRDGSFYIVDNGATNGTTVNGASIAPGQQRKIANNDTIKFADEEFQFKLM